MAREKEPNQRVKVESLPPPTERDKAEDKPKSAPKRPQGRPRQLEKRLTDLFTMIGLAVSPFNEFDGEVIVQNAESLAKGWDKLAQENARVKRVLEGLLATGTGGEVTFATLAVAIPILQNHNVIPRDLPLPFMAPPKPEPQARPEPQQTPGMPAAPAVP